MWFRSGARAERFHIVENLCNVKSVKTAKTGSGGSCRFSAGFRRENFRLACSLLESGVAGFACADTCCRTHIVGEDLAVTVFAGIGRSLDRIDNLVRPGFI